MDNARKHRKRRHPRIPANSPLINRYVDNDGSLHWRYRGPIYMINNPLVSEIEYDIRIV